uniref:Uncharacterized protein n=1 Tax=Cannabis sativa TaxID=3483 RepID=A0A803R5R7_CANSA
MAIRNTKIVAPDPSPVIVPMKHFIRVKASWLRSGHVDSQRAKRVSENVPLVVIFQIPSPDSQCTAIAQRRPPSTVESSELGQLLWCNKNEHNPVFLT